MNEQRFEFAADLETPVSAFLKLKPLHPVFLLESVEQNEFIGRYSFIGILPRQHFILQQGDDPSTFFRSLEDCLQHIRANGPLRLSSGLAGFFSYHAAAMLHPKLAGKKTGYPVAGFVLPDAILVFDHLQHKILFTSLLPPSQQADMVNEIRMCLRSLLPRPRSGKSTEPLANISKEEFCLMVNRAKEYIAAGDIYQVVLSMQFRGETKADPFQMYRALRMINPSPYMFYFNFLNEFQFFGSSPETMVRTEGNRILLRPIAGTRPRSPDPQEDRALEEDLMHDEKEKAEHLMLLDLARNDLGRISDTGSVRVKEFMKVERYSHVMHLLSTVESVATKRPSLQELFAAVFPAGTVTGAPKIRAMQIIDDLEPHSRDLYAGSLGYLGSNGEIDHCIAIRSVQAVGDKYCFCAGAGIVADSVPEREFEEIQNKAMALLAMLKLSEKSL